MKIIACVLLLVGITLQVAADEYCYNNVVKACQPLQSSQEPIKLDKCSAQYGAIAEIVTDLQSFANVHISRSFEYLMMSVHFENYEKSRLGFAKLYRDLSDAKWKMGIELIKYITKRGGQMDFNRKKGTSLADTQLPNYELYEVESIAKSLEIEKQIAEDAHHIHGEATRRREQYHDSETSSYIEELVHKQAKLIRTLAGHLHDLFRIQNSSDHSLGLYLFDEYLQKQ